MKKLVLSLLILAYSFLGVLALKSAVTEAAVIQNTVYLVIGPSATIQGQAGTDQRALNLKHAIVFKAAVGTTLPLPDPRAGLQFLGYATPAGGELDYIAQVPSVNRQILYAMWAPSTNPRSETPIPDTDRYLLLADLYLSPAEGVFDPRYQFSYKASEGDPSAVNFTEYYMTATFEAGYTFHLRSKQPLISGNSGTVYPNLQSQKEGLGYSLPTGAGKVSPNRTIDLIEVLGSPAVYNAVDFVFANGVSAGGLRFKRACTVNIYVVFYDNGGWVKFYVELA
jgi:hypothetical protein